MDKKTKIICTMGPALDEDKIKKLIENGMNAARLNFSHLSADEGLKWIKVLKKIRKDLNVPLAIILDTKGPEVRVYGHLESTKLEEGEFIEIISYLEDDISIIELDDKYKFLTNLPDITSLTKIGQNVLLMDGFVQGTIVDKTEFGIIVKLLNSGKLRCKAHLSIPNLNYPIPFISGKDKDDIIFAVKNNVDYIALSFVREKQDLLDVRNIIMDTDANSNIRIISKIENKEAIQNLDSILQLSDGIMVARGDLGVELPLEDVPVAQKKIIQNCYESGKPVITATQMLESMIENRIPTRAEASDVANACYDLTSLVMLSGETAIGKYPDLVVKTMSNIILKAEKSFPYYESFIARGSRNKKTDLTTIISYNAVSAAYQSKAAALIVYTKSGHSARTLSKHRSGLPIYAFTLDEHVFHQLSLNWGVFPYLIKEEGDFEVLIKNALDICEKKKWLKKGDLAVIVAGLPLGKRGTTNMIRIATVGRSRLSGKTVNNGYAEGELIFVKSEQDFEEKDISGKIVALNHFKKDYTPMLKFVKAIVMEDNVFEQELSYLGLAYNVPILVNVKGVLSKINEGTYVKVDGEKSILIDS